jgi:hypothetical protein
MYNSSLSDETMQKLEADLMPRLVAFDDAFYQNEKLFGRIEAMHRTEGSKRALNEEQARLLDGVMAYLSLFTCFFFLLFCLISLLSCLFSLSLSVLFLSF